jgi:hypothetical protein
MGLDILIMVEGEPHHPVDYSSMESAGYMAPLSRLFCNLMFRRDVSAVESELDQIGAITGLDISPFYGMLAYTTDSNVIDLLSFAETDEEKQRVFQQIEDGKAAARGNLPQVLTLIDSLLVRLALIEDLPARLDHGGWDTLNSAYYFDPSGGTVDGNYPRHNFMQDLRDFKLFLEDMREKGLKTVYFSIG